MSPIIYTPHRCAPSEDPDLAALSNDEVEGVIWQCPECQAYWEADVAKAITGKVVSFVWVCVGSPRQEAQRREIEAALKGTASTPTPTVTPHMVQLVVDTYSDHMSVSPSDRDELLGWCGECDTEIRCPYTIQAHAREKAAEALQGALDKAGRDE